VQVGCTTSTSPVHFPHSAHGPRCLLTGDQREHRRSAHRQPTARSRQQGRSRRQQCIRTQADEPTRSGKPGPGGRVPRRPTPGSGPQPVPAGPGRASGGLSTRLAQPASISTAPVVRQHHRGQHPSEPLVCHDERNLVMRHEPSDSCPRVQQTVDRRCPACRTVRPLDDFPTPRHARRLLCALPAPQHRSRSPLPTADPAPGRTPRRGQLPRPARPALPGG
jgi:hypothetical protein